MGVQKISQLRIALAATFCVLAFAALFATVRYFASADLTSGLWRQQIMDQRVSMINLAEHLGRLEKDIGNVQSAFANLQTNIDAVAEHPVVMAVSGRALKQTVVVEWQTTLLTSVLSTLKDYRSGLLRIGLGGVPVGLPNIAVWMNGDILSNAMNYGVFVGINAGVPIVVGLLASAIGTIFWCCCRPCRCCGQRIPKPEGYTVAERWIPVLCLFLFALTAGLMFLIGFAGSANITTGTSTVFDSIPTLINTLTGRANNMTSLVTQLGTQINDITTTVTTVLNNVNDATPLLQDFSNKMGNGSLGMQRVTADVYGTSSNLSDVRSIVGGLASHVAGAPSLSSIPTIPSSMLDQIREANTTGGQAFTQVVGAIQATISNIKLAQSTIAVGLNTTIGGIVGGLTTSLGGMLSTLTSTLGSVNGMITPMKSIVDMVMTYRGYGMWGFLGIPCLLFLIGLIGGAFQFCSTCFSQWFSCCMGFWSCAMWWWIFFMMGLHFAFAIILGDLCQYYVTEAPVSQNIPIVGTLTVYNLTNCNGNGNFINMILGVTNLSFPVDSGLSALSSITNLGDALNTTAINEQLLPLYSALETNFTSILDGFNMTDLTGVFSLIGSSVQTQTIDGGIYPSISTAQDALNWVNDISNSEAKPIYSFANISSMDPTAYTSGVQANMTTNRNLILSYNTAVVIVSDIRTNCSRAVSALNGVQPTLALAETTARGLNTDIQTNLASSKTLLTGILTNVTNSLTVVNPLKVTLDLLYDQGSCSLTSVFYQSVTTGICTQMSGGFTLLWFAFLCMGILILPQCVIGVIGATRYGVEYTGNTDGSDPSGGKGIPMEPLSARGKTIVKVDPLDYRPPPQIYDPVESGHYATAIAPPDYLPSPTASVQYPAVQYTDPHASVPMGQPQFYPAQSVTTPTDSQQFTTYYQ